MRWIVYCLYCATLRVLRVATKRRRRPASGAPPNASITASGSTAFRPAMKQACDGISRRLAGHSGESSLLIPSLRLSAPPTLGAYPVRHFAADALAAARLLTQSCPRSVRPKSPLAKATDLRTLDPSRAGALQDTGLRASAADLSIALPTDASARRDGMSRASSEVLYGLSASCIRPLPQPYFRLLAYLSPLFSPSS